MSVRQNVFRQNVFRQSVFRQNVRVPQFIAMCALAFFAFLRIGELTSTSKQSPTPLHLNQLTKLLRDCGVIGFK
jgi:hypothetical protein